MSRRDIEIKLFWDGDKVCALWGENLQEGLAGFGNNVPEALHDFANNWENIRGNEGP